MNIMKKGVIAASLAASALVGMASPAMARGYYRHHDNTAGVAIGAGIIGLAVGAIVASDHHDRYRDDRYYDRRYQAYDGRYLRDDRDRDWQRRGRDYDGRYYGRRGY